MFLEAVGGAQKGHVYGLGSHTPALFFDETKNRASSSSSASRASGLADVEARLMREMDQRLDTV